jgi:hypothetical protein
MAGARGCSILVDRSGIYGIHKDENEKTKKENKKDKSIILG